MLGNRLWYGYALWNSTFSTAGEMVYQVLSPLASIPLVEVFLVPTITFCFRKAEKTSEMMIRIKF